METCEGLGRFKRNIKNRIEVQFLLGDLGVNIVNTKEDIYKKMSLEPWEYRSLQARELLLFIHIYVAEGTQLEGWVRWVSQHCWCGLQSYLNHCQQPTRQNIPVTRSC